MAVAVFLKDTFECLRVLFHVDTDRTVDVVALLLCRFGFNSVHNVARFAVPLRAGFHGSFYDRQCGIHGLFAGIVDVVAGRLDFLEVFIQIRHRNSSGQRRPTIFIAHSHSPAPNAIDFAPAAICGI